MKEIEFIKDYAKFKKGDKKHFDSPLAARYVNVHGVAKYVESKPKDKTAK